MIDNSVKFFGQDNVKISNNVRIDAYTIISAGPKGVEIGNNVHIASFCHLSGWANKIVIESFVGISSRVNLFTLSDDYVEGYLTGPCVPNKYKKTTTGEIIIKKHAIIGAGTIILPGVIIGEGASIGALSLIKKNVPDYAIVVGTNQRQIGIRNKDRLKQLELEYLQEIDQKC